MPLVSRRSTTTSTSADRRDGQPRPNDLDAQDSQAALVGIGTSGFDRTRARLGLDVVDGHQVIEVERSAVAGSARVERSGRPSDNADTLRPMADTAPTPTRLVLIRHGESNVTVNRVIGGHRTCSGLSELGRQQADRLRDRLATTGELTPDVLIASNFPRAIETAQVVAPAFAGLSMAIDEGFGEHDPGPEIDGMTFDAYVDRFGMPDWSDPDVEVFPGGETIGTFHTRVAAALQTTIESHPGATVLIACHGGVIDATFRHLLRAPTTGAFELHTLNTSVTEFASVASGDWRLQRYNDVAHLHGLPSETPRVEPAAL